MPNTDEQTARSLSGSGAEILPYLPYLLQDLWELGSSPAEIIELIKKHVPDAGGLRVLDLACGKGAVSVKLARVFRCNVKGVDIMPEFIAYAKEKAVEYGVSALCTFAVGDIHKAVERERGYDIVILGAVGDVLGEPPETLAKLKATIKRNGYIVLADGYARGETEESFMSGNDTIRTREQWLQFFRDAGLKVAALKATDESGMREVNTFNNIAIGRRAEELIARHPEKEKLFEEYMQNQIAECEAMEALYVGVTWLLQAV